MRPSKSAWQPVDGALRLSEQRLRAAFERQFQFIVILAPDGRVLDFNGHPGAKGRRARRDEVLGQPFWRSSWWRDHLDLPLIWPERVNLSEDLPGPVCREDWFVASNGEDRCAQTAISAVCDAAGRLDCFIVQATDTTERRRAEALRQVFESQLRDTQKLEAIGTLAGGVAHDFNSIVGVILCNLALVRESIGPGHAGVPALEQVSKACHHARNLARQILAFERRDSQQPMPLMLRPLVEDTLALLRATLPAAVSLAPKLCAEEVCMLGHATQLQQVLLNLCTNAWHALPEGRGCIEVGMALSGPQQFELWVADDGVGMDEATVRRIFEPFFTTKPPGQGTGLGLSMVQNIVKEHGGRMEVSSVLRQGSRFSLFLPRGEGLAVAAERATTALVPLQGCGQMVLYVDDDEAMVTVVESLLTSAGFAVSSAASAADALALLAEWHWNIDAVITDQDMPGSTGIELAQHLVRQAPGLPVIVTSGYVSDQLRQQAQAIGVRHVLQKENTLEELAPLVCRMLGVGPGL